MEPNFEEILQEVARTQNVFDATIKIKARPEYGDNFFGDIKFVTIKGRKNQDLRLILKTAPKNLGVRLEISSEEAFSNEINFYEVIWRTYRKYLKRSKIECDSIPQCFSSSLQPFNEYLVLEDLKAKNYVEWSSRTPLDWTHTVLMVKEYAKLHALSVCYKQNDWKSFKNLKLHDIFYKFMDTPEKAAVTDDLNEDLISFVYSHFKDTPQIAAKFRDFARGMVPFYRAMSEWDCAQKSTVILHGDCWSNNVMFKYPDESTLQPDGLKFIDWQVAKKGPMVFDLSHAIYVCAAKSVYDDLDGLLAIYHDCFETFAKAVGVRRDNIITLAELEDQWRLYGRYGLYTASVQLKLLLNDTDKDAPQFSDVTDTGDVAMLAFKYIPTNDKYRARLTDAVRHCCERGFI